MDMTCWFPIGNEHDGQSLLFIYPDALLQRIETQGFRGEWFVFLPAMDQLRSLPDFPGDFSHLLCALHKKQNFLKKLNTCGESKQNKHQIKAFFDQVCYFDHLGMAEAALTDIKAFDNGRLNKYIQKHMQPVLRQFSKSRASDVFACGLNTSSAAESMNRMLKRGLVSRDHTLRQVREHFDARLNNHKALLASQALKSRSRPLPFELPLGIQIQREIRKKIQGEMKLAADLQVACMDEWTFQVQKKTLAGLIYGVIGDQELRLFKCSCNLVRHAGCPCSHILAVHDFTELPLSRDYFHRR
jgi:hypothetical protein